MIVGIVVLLPGCTSVPPVELEAENFSRGSGNAAVDRDSYGKTIGVILTPTPGAFVEYDFELPKSGDYDIELRLASAIARPLRLIVDGKVVNAKAVDQETGGFFAENQKWLEGGKASLTSGRHTLRLETDAVFPHIDKIRLKQVAFRIGG